jgi:hypothetical protein
MGLEGARQNVPKKPDEDIELRVIDKNEEARLREEAEWEAELKKEKDIGIEGSKLSLQGKPG